tara:strand:- start:62 stop:742 length:681 start_codon:yes stop_codon:yes gene_type:complete
MEIIILSAGMGTRLNKDIPKSLTLLKNGESILERQIKSLIDYVDKKNITIVVGYKNDMIQEKYPDYHFVYNKNFKTTNTAKSLLCAINAKEIQSDIIWLNGDVVFDPTILKYIFESKKSSMLVNSESVGEEEVKYSTKKDGTIDKVSKHVKNALGEAVGINKIISCHVKKFKAQLEQCEDTDYFERGIELLINNSVNIHPINISKYFCCEIDTPDDLDFVNKNLKK